MMMSLIERYKEQRVQNNYVQERTGVLVSHASFSSIRGMDTLKMGRR